MNLLDAVVLAFILFYLIKGYFTGFARTFKIIINFIVSILIFGIFFKDLHNWILKTRFFLKIKDWSMEQLVNLTGGEINPENLLNNIEFVNIPDFLKDFVGKNIDLETLGNINLSEYLSQFFAIIITSVVAIFIINIIVYIIFIIFDGIFNLFSKVPIVKKIDRILGLIVGGLKSIIILYILQIFIMPFILNPSFIWLKDLLDNSIITSKILSNNFLVNFILHLFEKF